MKFLLTALLLCICSVEAQEAQEEYYGYYEGEAAVAEEYAGERFYTRRNRPTTEPAGGESHRTRRRHTQPRSITEPVQVLLLGRGGCDLWIVSVRLIRFKKVKMSLLLSTPAKMGAPNRRLNVGQFGKNLSVTTVLANRQRYATA